MDRIPFIAHHLLSPWPLKIPVFHVQYALSSTGEPRTWATPIFPEAVSLAARTWLETSPSPGGPSGTLKECLCTLCFYFLNLFFNFC